MQTFADKILAFNAHLDFTPYLPLPKDVGIMNPFRENDTATPASTLFYKKYYDDHNLRHCILGINPGRFGAGLTGIPFTDPKRLKEKCHLPYEGPDAHEPSSVFIYEMIEACGGAEKFYASFYINSVCPLGFTTVSASGKSVNYNYYDKMALQKCARPFIIQSIREQLAICLKTDVCFCLGTGKNMEFLKKLNDEEHFFGKIVALEHPRYIMQYRSKTRSDYIGKYRKAFAQG
ncbi:MAG: DUF4918 family protein [Desulfovibrio sp.]|jgi:hypothetical protein|nr:DUF4918 family protein [Desulfovibrio sp.]